MTVLDLKRKIKERIISIISNRELLTKNNVYDENMYRLMCRGFLNNDIAILATIDLYDNCLQVIIGDKEEIEDREDLENIEDIEDIESIKRGNIEVKVGEEIGENIIKEYEVDINNSIMYNKSNLVSQSDEFLIKPLDSDLININIVNSVNIDNVVNDIEENKAQIDIRDINDINESIQRKKNIEYEYTGINYF